MVDSDPHFTRKPPTLTQAGLEVLEIHDELALLSIGAEPARVHLLRKPPLPSKASNDDVPSRPTPHQPTTHKTTGAVRSMATPTTRSPLLPLLLLLLLASIVSSDAFFSRALNAARTCLRSRRRAAGLVTAGGQPFKAEKALAPDFCLAILGDLHLDRNDMGLHNEGRQHVVDNMAKLKSGLSSPKSQARLVSLGDLGAYGDAGTTTCFEHAKEYLEGYGLPFNLVTG